MNNQQHLDQFVHNHNSLSSSSSSIWPSSLIDHSTTTLRPVNNNGGGGGIWSNGWNSRRFQSFIYPNMPKRNSFQPQPQQQQQSLRSRRPTFTELMNQFTSSQGNNNRRFTIWPRSWNLISNYNSHHRSSSSSSSSA